MTELQKQYGPFAESAPSGFKSTMTHMTLCDTGDRIKLVRASTDRQWLVAVIKDREVQQTVKHAALRRLNQLKKLSAAPAQSEIGNRQS
jgi:hypothetical protein